MAQDDPKASAREQGAAGEGPELTEAELERIAGGFTGPGSAAAAPKTDTKVSQNNLKQIGLGAHNY